MFCYAILYSVSSAICVKLDLLILRSQYSWTFTSGNLTGCIDLKSLSTYWFHGNFVWCRSDWAVEVDPDRLHRQVWCGNGLGLVVEKGLRGDQKVRSFALLLLPLHIQYSLSHINMSSQISYTRFLSLQKYSIKFLIVLKMVCLLLWLNFFSLFFYPLISKYELIWFRFFGQHILREYPKDSFFSVLLHFNLKKHLIFNFQNRFDIYLKKYFHSTFLIII